MCGIDIELMLQGAAYMDELSKEEDFYKNPAYMFALLSYIAMEQGKNISVMMPYADSLKYVSDWFAQLWAESLGKKVDNSGNVGKFRTDACQIPRSYGSAFPGAALYGGPLR